MAKTLGDLRNRTRSYLDEESAADWTDAEINSLINTYYHKVFTAVIDVFENYSPIKTAKADIKEDKQEYALPPDFLKLRRLEVKYNSGDTLSRAIPTIMDAVPNDLGAANLGPTIMRSPNYYLRGNNFGLIPVPDTDVSAGIKLWYSPKKADLINDVDVIDLPYPDRDWILIVWGASSEALSFGQQETVESTRLERKYTKGIEKMQRELEDRIQEGTKVVIDTSGESVDFSSDYW